MQISLCSVDFEMLFWTPWTCANHSENFAAWWHWAWRMICDVKQSGERTCVAGLQNRKTFAVKIMLSSDDVRFE